jgi:hypothetical protein
MNPESMLPYEEETKVRGLLRAAAAGDGMSTPDRVERVLVERMRQARRRAAGMRVFAAGAIAATVLFGLGLLRDREESAPVAAIAPAPAAPAVAVAAEAAPAIEPAKPARRRRANRERAPRMETAEFIPVGAWQAIEPMERGSIVRVRLSKSTLPALGIPVSPDVWNETVPADVVLGEDGTMRAVRFVRTAQ